MVRFFVYFSLLLPLFWNDPGIVADQDGGRLACKQGLEETRDNTVVSFGKCLFQYVFTLARCSAVLGRKGRC